MALVPLSDPSPTNSATMQSSGFPHPSEYLWLLPCNRCAKTKKKMAQIKEQIKAPEIIQLSSEQIANLSDAHFKKLVIRMLQELTRYFNSIKKDPGNNEGCIM